MSNRKRSSHEQERGRPRQRLLGGFEDPPQDEPPAPPGDGPEFAPPGAPTSGAHTAGSAAPDPPDQHSPAPTGQTKSAASATPRSDLPEDHSAGPGMVCVVDAHALIYQVFHAMPDMQGPQGQPVGATHGFIRDVVELIERKRPDALFCAFDHPGDTFRHELYEGYKQHREAMPEDLRPQIDQILQMLRAMGVATLSVPNFEADDILATVAARVEHLGGTCLLVTNDKDCRQLISERVAVYNIRKDLVYDASALAADWGIRPEQVVDFQALVGDKVDNVPGVPQIGPKTATELLQRYGTLDEILDHAGEVKAKARRENLLRHREQALLSRDLVRLRSDVPLELDWEAGRYRGGDAAAVEQLCRELGFRRLAERVRSLESSLQLEATPTAWETSYRVLDELDEVRRWLTTLEGTLGIATISEPQHPRFAALTGLALSRAAGEGCYLPLRGPDGARLLPPVELWKVLGPVLEDPTIDKVGHHLKRDVVLLRSQAQIALRGLRFDAQVADYLLDPGERNHGLEDLGHRYLNHRGQGLDELLGTGRQRRPLDSLPTAEVLDYAASRADLPLRLREPLTARLAQEQAGSLFQDLEMPLIEVLAAMEFQGIRLDLEWLDSLAQRFQERLTGLEAEIHGLAGHEFNLDSRQQLATVLFEELGLPVIKKTSTGPSTDAEVLTQLAEQSGHPLPARLLAYRHDAKLKGTYVDALPQLVHPQTGRIHTLLLQDVAATGRLSSAEPNLQNIPVRTPDGREIRAAFIADQPGWSLLSADYSQIELRVLAHFSQDTALLEAFQEGQDIHRRVAAEVFGVELAAVTSDQRRRAKAVNFGVIYGQTSFGLAKALGIPKEEAAQFIEAYFARYPNVLAFMEDVLDRCRRDRFVQTILGRRRRVDGVRAASKRSLQFRSLPERVAVNTVIQGSAADLIKLAMLRVHERLHQWPGQARLLLQIHDELLLEMPKPELEQIAPWVREEMEQAHPLAAPLVVDLRVGRNWADTDSWDASENERDRAAPDG